jgi:acetolactate synthase-1/2/3 large subunit
LRHICQKEIAVTKPEESATTGADLLVKALIDEEVEVVFGYPGGAVLPIYDSLFKQNRLRHILVRHEQAAVHAAEGYARSTGKVGVVLVTSGPGATNAVTGLTDALMDSIPIVCLTGQVPTHLIGNDAFQEADTTGITRPCTKHNYLVKSVSDLARSVHEAFYVARSGRPGPVVIDLPKDVLMNKHEYTAPPKVAVTHKSYRPQTQPDPKKIEQAIEMIAKAKRPVFYAGGGIINSGPKASKLLTQFVHLTGYPVTNTLMGLGAFPASDKQFLGMLGMHGTYEANLAMHGCDVMINIGARFDDRITGNLTKFSPGSKKIHVDIDPSSINKNVHVDLAIVGDAGIVLEELVKAWKAKQPKVDQKALKAWWSEIDGWRGRNCLAYKPSQQVIKPQYALERLYHHIKDRDHYITTEVGQHQMWAAQFLKFEQPNRWMTSGGLGTMGYGFPAALGVQIAHPEALVIDVAGEASILMNIQELSTAAQYRLPVKIFVLNNHYMGMVRQWQELLHGGRYSESYSESLPDFVKVADAFGAKGLRCEDPAKLDDTIKEMIELRHPVIVDVIVDEKENCFPMIPSGAAHNEMLLGPDDKQSAKVSEEGMVLV